MLERKKPVKRCMFVRKNEYVSFLPTDVDSLVDESEIKKRISYCGIVRKNTVNIRSILYWWKCKINEKKCFYLFQNLMKFGKDVMYFCFQSRSIRKARHVQTQAYNQMFDFCLIVGLQPNNDHTAYKPKIIYKFPDLVSMMYRDTFWFWNTRLLGYY